MNLVLQTKLIPHVNSCKLHPVGRTSSQIPHESDLHKPQNSKREISYVNISLLSDGISCQNLKNNDGISCQNLKKYTKFQNLYEITKMQINDRKTS